MHIVPYGKKVSKRLEIRNEDVYKLLLRIPAGRVSTYGDIAKNLGHPYAARIIGKILNKNPNPISVPCHRVVNSNGKLGGYLYGILMKKALLEKEGIKFQNENISDFSACRMNFKKEANKNSNEF